MTENRQDEELDLMMRSILDSGREEVPGHVWDGIVKGLDRAGRKRAALRWRRVAVATAAAALVVMAVLGWDALMPEIGKDAVAEVTDIGRNADWNGKKGIDGIEDFEEDADSAGRIEKGRDIFVQEDGGKDLISVIRTSPDEKTALTAYVEPEDKSAEKTMETVEKISAGRQEVTVENARKTEDTGKNPEGEDNCFEEDCRKAGKIRTSILLSGTAATNNPQNKSRSGMMRRPATASVPKKTTVAETGASSTYGLPVSVGVSAKIGFTPRWALSIGADYTLLTRRFSGTYTFVDENGNVSAPVTSDIRNNLHYIGIPVNAYYNIISKEHINFYAYLGGAVEKCVANRYEIFAATARHSERVKGVQWSANAGIGVEFLLGKHLGLYIDPSLRYYFDCGQPKSIRTAQPLMLGFELGLRILL